MEGYESSDYPESKFTDNEVPHNNSEDSIPEVKMPPSMDHYLDVGINDSDLREEEQCEIDELVSTEIQF